MAANLSELPKDILGQILNKLPFPDLIRCRSVCVAWRNLVSDEKIQPRNSQAPWLMLSGDDNVASNFYSLTERRTYRIPSPFPSTRRRIWIGSSFGWLITVDVLCEMHLVNPLTGVQVALPSIATLPSLVAVPDPGGCPKKFFLVEEAPNKRSLVWLINHFFHKAVLLSPPSSDGRGFTVVLICGTSRTIASAREGDASWWTPPQRWTPSHVTDVIPHRGRMYTVDLNGVLDVWEEDSDRGFTRRSITGGGLVPSLQKHIKYLVVDQSGRLVMVLRHRTESTLEVKVLVFDEDQCRWAYLDSLGDNVIFIGDNRSMSVSLKEVPELRRDCVYFAGDFRKTTGFHKCDIGMFDIRENRQIEIFDRYLNWHRPIWFTPSMH